MTKKIVELVQEKDFITLKSILEEKVAYKIKEKIDAKKEEFKEKAKSLYGRKPLTETDHVFSEKLYAKLNSNGYKNMGGVIPLGKDYKVMVDVTGNDVEVQVLKGKSAVSAKSIFFDTTPIVKGLEHAVAFVSQVIKEVVLPDIHKADEKKEK